MLSKLLCSLALLAPVYSRPTHLEARADNLTTIPPAPPRFGLAPEPAAVYLLINCAQAAHAMIAYTEAIWTGGAPPPGTHTFSIDDHEARIKMIAFLMRAQYSMGDLVSWASLKILRASIAQMSVDAQEWRLYRYAASVAGARIGEVSFRGMGPSVGLPGGINASLPAVQEVLGTAPLPSRNITASSFSSFLTTDPDNANTTTTTDAASVDANTLPIRIYEGNKGNPMPRKSVLTLINALLDPIWSKDSDDKISDSIQQGEVVRRTYRGVRMIVTYNRLVSGSTQITWDYIVSATKTMLLSFALEKEGPWREITFTASLGAQAEGFYIVRFEKVGGAMEGDEEVEVPVDEIDDGVGFSKTETA